MLPAKAKYGVRDAARSCARAGVPNTSVPPTFLARARTLLVGFPFRAASTSRYRSPDNPAPTRPPLHPGPLRHRHPRRRHPLPLLPLLDRPPRRPARARRPTRRPRRRAPRLQRRSRHPEPAPLHRPAGRRDRRRPRCPAHQGPPGRRHRRGRRARRLRRALVLGPQRRRRGGALLWERPVRVPCSLNTAFPITQYTHCLDSTSSISSSACPTGTWPCSPRPRRRQNSRSSRRSVTGDCSPHMANLYTVPVVHALVPICQGSADVSAPSFQIETTAKVVKKSEFQLRIAFLRPVPKHTNIKLSSLALFLV